MRDDIIGIIILCIAKKFMQIHYFYVQVGKDSNKLIKKVINIFLSTYFAN